MTGIPRRRFLREGALALAAVSAWPLRGQGFMAFAGSTTPGLGSGIGPLGDPALLDLLAEIVGDLERMVPYASVLLTSTCGMTFSRDRTGSRIEEVPGVGRGASIRAFDGETFHEAATSDLTPVALRAAAAQLLKGVSVVQERYRIEPLSPLVRSWRNGRRPEESATALRARFDELEADFRRVDWDDPRVRNVQVSVDEIFTERVFVDRTRRLAAETLMTIRGFRMSGVDEGRFGASFLRVAGQGKTGAARITDEAIEEGRRELVDSLGAGAVPPGEYDVILSPAVTGLLAHESFGHGVELDQFVRERARSRHFLGKMVASPIVNLFDDPSIEGARGSYPFDDEGMLSAPTQIIKDGIFVRPLTDLMSAARLDMDRSPNGRTQGYERKVYSRMSNTFIARGNQKVEELQASLAHGLYLEGFRNGIEDPQGWGIQFTARLGREVRDGKLTGRVFSPVTVTGYVPEILSNITMVADDFALGPGTCGKGFKEWVPITSGGPHLRTRARVS